jgi:hypothetical protein
MARLKLQIKALTLNLALPLAAIAFLVALVSPSYLNAQALKRSRLFNAKIYGDHLLLSALHSKPARKGDRFPIISFTTSRIFGLGRITLFVTRRKLPAAQAAIFSKKKGETKDSNVPTLLKGYLLLGNRQNKRFKIPAAISIFNRRVGQAYTRTVKATFLTPTTSPYRDATHNKLFTLSWRLTANPGPVAAKVSFRGGGSLLGKDCRPQDINPAGVLTAKGSKSPSSGPTTFDKVKTLSRVITISTDSDPEWYKKYGEASNAEIAAIINAAEAIYERSLGLRFAIAKQHVYTDIAPYTSTNPSLLLSSFRDNPLNATNLGFGAATFHSDIDLKHLFTGRELDGSVVGLSYVATSCSAPQNAYGLTQDTEQGLNITTFAHEVGHNLGASHDVLAKDTIMAPNLTITRDFSGYSIDQISRRLALTGQCFGQQLVGANLATASLTLSGRYVKEKGWLVLKGGLISNLAQPLPGEVVKLTLNQRVVTYATTNIKGEYTARVRTSRFKRVKRVSVVAETKAGEVRTEKPLSVQIGA